MSLSGKNFKSPSPKQLLQLPALPVSFYNRKTTEVAKDLIGKVLVMRHKSEVLAAQLMEVEAYLGQDDPASHSARGPTERNRPMFELGGTCYVYLIYGIHHCTNVATGPQGHGEAVLFRAAKGLVGLERMARNRGLGETAADSASLLVGPGNLSRALGIDRKFSGRSFLEADFKLVDCRDLVDVLTIRCTPRIGISKAIDLPLRFYWEEAAAWVSRLPKLSKHSGRLG